MDSRIEMDPVLKWASEILGETLVLSVHVDPLGINQPWSQSLSLSL